MPSKLSLLSQATTVGWAVWAFPFNEALEFVQTASPQDIDDGEWPAIWMCLARVESSSILPILRALLDRGASVAPRLPNNETLLGGVLRAFLYSEDDCLDAISLLIEHGVPLNTVNNSGISPLYVAVQNSLDDVVQLLLHGAITIQRLYFCPF
jgi:ankyrin repeat protein